MWGAVLVVIGIAIRALLPYDIAIGGLIAAARAGDHPRSSELHGYAGGGSCGCTVQ